MLRLILITNDIELAKQAEAAGVARIMVDLERLGKQERQGHLDTLISAHSVEDIARIRGLLSSAELIVRVNPLHSDSRQEIDTVIDQGAEVLMLPMFRTADEVAEFCEMVDGRARVMPLVETGDAAKALEAIVAVRGVSEIYIGLNDLHLDLGLAFMFEPLASGLIDSMAATIKSAQLPFGFGGVARIGQGAVPGELVLAEHARLGSETVILSRAFQQGLIDAEKAGFIGEVKKLQAFHQQLIERDLQQIEADRCRFIEAVRSHLLSRANEAPV